MLSSHLSKKFIREIVAFAIIAAFGPVIISGNMLAWARWWSYDGISGPDFWGVLNPRWRMCTDGKRQSPININLTKLLYDPSLKDLTISGQSLNGVLMNTGSGVTVVVSENSAHNVYVTSGPLSYTYKLGQIKFRYSQETGMGSEHRVGGVVFPGELQLIFYNYEIYQNRSIAQRSPYGVATIALFVQTGNTTHQAFDVIAKSIAKVKIRGQQRPIHIPNIQALLPNVSSYVTYSGSLTEPPCHETVTWIVLNRPIYVTVQQLSAFYQLNKGGPSNPTMILERNNRGIMPIYKRPVRTNINKEKGCFMKTKTHYKGERFT